MRFTTMAFAFVLFNSTANAWEATIEGPDVFGNVKVFSSEYRTPSESLVVECDSNGKLLLAYIFRKKEFQEVSILPATLLVMAENNNILKLKAELRSWNDNYAGIVASEDKDQTLSAIRAIRDARGKIEVGAEIAGNQISASFGSRGSSKSMKKVLESCKLEPQS